MEGRRAGELSPPPLPGPVGCPMMACMRMFHPKGYLFEALYILKGRVFYH